MVATLPSGPLEVKTGRLTSSYQARWCAIETIKGGPCFTVRKIGPRLDGKPDRILPLDSMTIRGDDDGLGIKVLGADGSVRLTLRAANADVKREWCGGLTTAPHFESTGSLLTAELGEGDEDDNEVTASAESVVKSGSEPAVPVKSGSGEELAAWLASTMSEMSQQIERLAKGGVTRGGSGDTVLSESSQSDEAASPRSVSSRDVQLALGAELKSALSSGGISLRSTTRDADAASRGARLSRERADTAERHHVRFEAAADEDDDEEVASVSDAVSAAASDAAAEEEGLEEDIKGHEADALATALLARPRGPASRRSPSFSPSQSPRRSELDDGVKGAPPPMSTATPFNEALGAGPEEEEEEKEEEEKAAEEEEKEVVKAVEEAQEERQHSAALHAWALAAFDATETEAEAAEVEQEAEAAAAEAEEWEYGSDTASDATSEASEESGDPLVSSCRPLHTCVLGKRPAPRSEGFEDEATAIAAVLSGALAGYGAVDARHRLWLVEQARLFPENTRIPTRTQRRSCPRRPCPHPAVLPLCALCPAGSRSRISRTAPTATW